MALDPFARDFRSVHEIDLLKELPVMTIDHKEAITLPLGLIDLLLIMAGPKVMAIVHFLLRQSDLSLEIPAPGRQHGHRSREVRLFLLSQLKLGINPDFPNSLDAGFCCA